MIHTLEETATLIEKSWAQIHRSKSHKDMTAGLPNQGGTMKKTLISLIASFLVLLPASLLAASFADMVFVVDQSGSMYNEFQWISNSLKEINSTVEKKGIKANYGIAGFEYTAGTLSGYYKTRNAWADIPSDIATVVAEAEWAANNLYGGIERSYQAVDWAADNFAWTGNDFAKVMILITDEDADYAETYSYKGMTGEKALSQKMKDEDILLNVITYSILYSVWDDVAFAKDDYIGLFDLDYLKNDPTRFTADFTYAKINEIMEHEPSSAQPVPEPGTLFLLGSGLLGLGGYTRKSKKTTRASLA